MVQGGRPDETPLTKDELSAVAALKRLAKRWPKSLWLFSASGSLHVMRTATGGAHALTPGLAGGVDPDYKVAKIDIPNDGGEW